MFIEMTKRNYTMRKRADSQEQTRRRIVEATVELHGTLGPKNTSISSVARKAGVRRLTVYRHFPDEAALFAACSSLWLSQHPPPDPHAWGNIGESSGRTRAALWALYAWYHENESMLRLTYRDQDEVPALHAPMQAFQAYLDAIGTDLATCWHPQGRRPRSLVATIAHALAFSTWSSLHEQGLTDARIGRLVTSWIEFTA